MGSLCIVHDVSCMVDLDTEVCSAGLMIFCTISGQTLKCAVAERSSEAGNYRGEILGGIICQLILRAASRRMSSPYRAVAIHCNNMGVICHGNGPSQPLLDGQSQADALGTLKHLVLENPFSSYFTCGRALKTAHSRRN